MLVGERQPNTHLCVPEEVIAVPLEQLVRLEAFAKLMDGAFVIPGTTIRFGLDGIIGLIPVAGDMIAGLVSTYLIWEAKQLGAPRWLIARTLANVFHPGRGRRV